MEDEPQVKEVPEVIEGESSIVIHDDQLSLLLEQDELQKSFYEDTAEQISILTENISTLNQSVVETPQTITYEQAEQIIGLLNSAIEMGGYCVAGVLVWFVLKQLYRLFGGVLFGGV